MMDGMHHDQKDTYRRDSGRYNPVDKQDWSSNNALSTQMIGFPVQTNTVKHFVPCGTKIKKTSIVKKTLLDRHFHILRHWMTARETA